MSGVPFVDLGWQHREVERDVRAGFDRVFETTSFIDGPPVAEFEEAFAAACGADHCVGVSNGTDAIELALRAIGVGVGDEVIIPANTFIATAEAVVRSGADVALVDCDEESLLIDAEAAIAAIGPRTRAVIGVHLYGQMAPLEAIVDAASAAGVAVLEDAAQAQGATRHGRGIGSFGVAAPTSFYPGKNLGAYGDAGAVVTNDAGVAEAVSVMRNHGSSRRYHHDQFGCNARLDTLQAVVLGAKLRRLPVWNDLRREAALRYEELLSDVEGLRLPSVAAGNTHVWHLYVVRVPQRDRVLDALHGAGVSAAIHYPVPVHLHGAYAGLGQGLGSHPVAERAAGEILSLPMFPGITCAQQEQVAAALRTALVC